MHTVGWTEAMELQVARGGGGSVTMSGLHIGVGVAHAVKAGRTSVCGVLLNDLQDEPFESWSHGRCSTCQSAITSSV